MKKLDDQLLDEFASLPGWSDLVATPAPSPSPDTLQRATQVVLEAIARDASGGEGKLGAGTRGNRSANRRRGHVRWAVAAMAAAAVAAFIVAAPTISSPGSTPPSVASATEVLTRLASTASAAPGIDAKYWKVVFKSVDLSDTSAASGRESTTTLWYGRDGGQWIVVDGKLIQSTPEPARFGLPGHAALSWNEVAALSSDPATLEDDLKSLIGPRASVVEAVGGLLATAPLSASQRAAMFTILSRQEGVSMQPQSQDALGRPGAAFGFAVGPYQTATLVVSDSGVLLEDRLVASIDHDKALDVPRTSDGSAGPDPAQTATMKGDLLSRVTYVEANGTDAAPVT